MLPSPDIKELTLRDYMEVVRKRLWIVVACLLFVTSAVAFRDFQMVPVYQASSSILIEERTPKVISIEDVYQAPLSNMYYPTEYNMMHTRLMAERVFKKLNLAQEPEFQTKKPINKLLKMFDVQPVKNTKMAVISVRGIDPVLITRIVNSWAEEYMMQDVEKRVESAQHATSWLEEQLSDVKEKLTKAENDLQSFIKNNSIVTIPNIDKERESLLDQLKQQRISAEKEIAEASKRYKEKHPKMISLTTQLNNIKEKLAEETDNLMNLQEKMVQYKILKREVDTYQSLYDSLLKRAKEVDISEKLESSNIRIIDKAEVPSIPIAPKKTRDIALSFIMSMVLGIGVCFLLEYIDTTLKTSEDVEFYVKIPFLSYIQLVKGREMTDLFCHSKPTSQVAESFRNLRVSLIFSSPEEKPLKKMVVSSAIPGEGKTFVSINLATVFAQAKEKTILVDADMRKGRVHKVFKSDNKKGLSSALAGVYGLDEVIRNTEVEGLDLITCGPYAPNPAELLNSKLLVEIFEELSKRYDRIIVDSPPVLTVSDSLILSNMLDGIVYVIRAKHTQIKFIRESKRRMVDTRSKIIGAVLNSVDLEKDKYYYYHYYYSSYTYGSEEDLKNKSNAIFKKKP